MRRAIRQAEPVGRGGLRLPRPQARAAPGRRGHVPAAAPRADQLRERDARERLGPGPARRPDRRDPRRVAGPRSCASTRTPRHALVCLIPRLIDPKVGRVRIDGLDLRDVTLESVRAQVATVLQADLVFSDTVLANIAPGRPELRPPPGDRGRQGGPRPPLHPGPAPRLRHGHRPARRTTSSPTSSTGSPWPGPSSTTPRS